MKDGRRQVHIQSSIFGMKYIETLAMLLTVAAVLIKFY
jgi:hypothetical protein